MSQKKVNGNGNILTPEQENMRLQVVDLELKARYWKAQYEIRQFTLEAEKLQPDYDKYLAAQKEQQEKFMEDMRKQIAALNKQAEEGKINVESKEDHMANEAYGSLTDEKSELKAV